VLQSYIETYVSNRMPLPRPKTLTFDHVYPSPVRELESPPRTAIFYASLSSSNFHEIHSYLIRLAGHPSPRVEYIFRPVPSTNKSAERSSLTGYGVAMDLKKMDYLAVDDRKMHKS